MTSSTEPSECRVLDLVRAYQREGPRSFPHVDGLCIFLIGVGLGMLIIGMTVAKVRKHPNGRVDQLEDRYLGMVEAPSSTRHVHSSFFIDNEGVVPLGY